MLPTGGCNPTSVLKRGTLHQGKFNLIPGGFSHEPIRRPPKSFGLDPKHGVGAYCRLVLKPVDSSPRLGTIQQPPDPRVALFSILYIEPGHAVVQVQHGPKARCLFT